MRIALTTLALSAAILTALLAGSCDVCHAQDQSGINTASISTDHLTPVSPAEVPQFGTFYSINGFPPMPTDWLVGYAVYALGNGCFVVDDSSLNYGEWTTAMKQVNQRAQSLDDSGPPPLLGGGGGSGSSGGGPLPEGGFNPPPSGYYPCETWTNFWLKISASSGVIDITITNTLPGLSYILLKSTSLNHPFWVPFQTNTASGTSIAATPISAGTNATLFFQAMLTASDQPPVITAAPANQVVYGGSSAVFSVAATGLGPLSYQWMHDGTNLPGQTSSALTIGNVQSNKVGVYTVIVSNVICTASAEAGLGLAWSKSLGAPIDASPAIGPDGIIYILNSANQFFALDPVIGGIKWSVNLGNGYDYGLTPSAAVAAEGSAVYVAALNDTLYAFTTNGTLLWSDNLGTLMSGSPAVGASDGTIYAATFDPYRTPNALFAINPSTGATNWVFQTDDSINGGDGTPIDSSPAVGPDCTIYFLSSSGDLFAVSPSGTLQWFFPLPAALYPSSSPAIGEDGTIYVGSGGGYLYAISPDGTLEWIFDSADGAAINSSPAIGEDGTVYIASTDGNLYAVTNGILKWQFADPNGYPFISSPAVAADGTVYIGSEDDNVYIVNNGIEITNYSTQGQVLSSPTIAADGGVYIGSEDGHLYSLPGSAELASSAWSMFHENPAHTGATPNPSCTGGASLVAFPNNPSFPNPGQFTFHISGTPGSTWAVLASSDLVSWVTIDYVSLDAISGNGSYQDPDIDGIANRFYELESGSSCSQIIGFMNATIPTGTSLIANQLYQAGQWNVHAAFSSSRISA
ncbi:MAG: PQQ-binding-like beta-propeller repeat protein [Verrucomicrobiota bacterium]|jgi:outer membrane protein assembly factor BamB